MYIIDSDGSNLKCITNDLDQTPGAPFWSENSSIYFNVDLDKVMYTMQT